MNKHKLSAHRHRAVMLLVVVIFAIGSAVPTLAHPLGNFTINHFARIEADAERIRIKFVVDMAEVPTLQEMREADADADGSLSDAELHMYAERIAPLYGENLRLSVDGVPVRLLNVARTGVTTIGEAGLPTLRVECEYAGAVPAKSEDAVRRIRFENLNHPGRIGWHEVVIAPSTGVSIFAASAFADSATNELRAYPADFSAGPLDERAAEFSFTEGIIPTGVAGLRSRNLPVAGSGDRRAAPVTTSVASAAAKPGDRLAELIGIRELTPTLALLGLLLAAGLGAVHALSPGHGKTVVGAYLVGSRGTPRHAVFLGLTVTVTHTLGVFALGLVTLFASQYIVPERLLSILSFVSGGIVLVIGLSLFVRRLRSMLGYTAHVHGHSHYGQAHDRHVSDDQPLYAGARRHDHVDDYADDDNHQHDPAFAGAQIHSHGGRPHSHLPPGADGVPVTWRSLFALGVSGGLLPCPSALVVLLSAIAIQRTGYGLLLVIAFSMGLAGTLTGIGLLFVCAGRLLKESAVGERFCSLARIVPTASAFVVMCVGIVICYDALVQSGALSPAGMYLGTIFAAPATQAGSLPIASVLAFGFGLGFKHAIEADHLAAVSTIVTERKSLLSSSLVGGLWGVGHTISLLIVGVAVILLQVQIGERTALALEFVVALMLVGLGVNAITKFVGDRGSRLRRYDDDDSRAQLKLHRESFEVDPHSRRFGLGKRTLLIGMVHGLAGSAALMLLVLSTISAPLVALGYIVIFGVGSIGGMMLMSTLVGLPVHLTALRFAGVDVFMRGLAGLFSLGFGLFMVYEIGFVNNLFR